MLPAINVRRAALCNERAHLLVGDDSTPSAGGERMQVYVSALGPHGTIPLETHARLTQKVRVEAGHGEVHFVESGAVVSVEVGDECFIRAGVAHEIRAGPTGMKLSSTYAKDAGDADWIH